MGIITEYHSQNRSGIMSSTYSLTTIVSTFIGRREKPNAQAFNTDASHSPVEEMRYEPSLVRRGL